MVVLTATTIHSARMALYGKWPSRYPNRRALGQLPRHIGPMKVDAPVSTMNLPLSVRNRSMSKSNSRWSTLPSFRRFSLLTANPRYSANVWLTGSASMASTSCPFDNKYCERMADTRLFPTPPFPCRGWVFPCAPCNHVERVVAHLQTFSLECFPNIFQILPRGYRRFYFGKKSANNRHSSLGRVGCQSF